MLTTESSRPCGEIGDRVRPLREGKRRESRGDASGERRAPHEGAHSRPAPRRAGNGGARANARIGLSFVGRAAGPHSSDGTRIVPEAIRRN